ncbi:hypothetical protein MRX96_016262 [Rhipicephalus microplus]
MGDIGSVAKYESRFGRGAPLPLECREVTTVPRQERKRQGSGVRRGGPLIKIEARPWTHARLAFTLPSATGGATTAGV